MIDRLIRDVKGIRWVVDYKTSRNEGADVEGFLDREQKRYGAQLDAYAAALGGASRGLYFPLHTGWRDWGINRNLERRQPMKSKAKRWVPAKKAAAPKKKVQPIPAGYSAVTPYLSVRGAAEAIEFYKKAFGAKEIMRMPGPDGKLGHAEISIGGSRVMLSDEYEALAFLSPQARGGTTVHIHLYVKDVDASVARATAAGAKVTWPVKDQFYGDRTGSIEDPFGHMWHVATHKEDFSKAEMTRRAAEAAKQAGG